MSRRRQLDQCGGECGCTAGCRLEDRAELDDGWENEPSAEWLDNYYEARMP